MAKSTTDTEKATNNQRPRLIDEWEEKLRKAMSSYAPILEEINDNYEAYKGTRPIYNSNGTKANKQKSSVRKVVFELVEAQVNTDIPQPKVTSVTGNYKRAQVIEHYLKNELDRLPMERINDIQARVTSICGSSIFLVEWDNNVKTRNTIGNLSVRNLSPTEIVPQPGVYDINKMDYIFIRLLQTKLEIYNRYGVDVSEEGNSEENDKTHNDELVTHNYVYYKNKNGEISLFSWVNDTIVQNIDNYFARKQYVCEKCHTAYQTETEDGTCANCGSKKFKLETLKNEKLTIPKLQVNPLTGEQTIVEEEIEVPYYIPKRYPLVLRTNASDIDSLLGTSDVSAIKDQQNDLTILMKKIKEKELKGGSLVTVPESLDFKATDEELKIVRVKNPAEAQMINAKSLQPNVSNDINLLSINYEIARQTIGITDSYQGRRDNTALSGKAKEFAAAQTAGRLNSKLKMKEFAFSELFEVMFQFILAYSDEPRYYNYQDAQGMLQYGIFDKRLFLEQDKNGNYYYDDEFIFAVDVSATLANDRKAMWEETRLNFSTGAYGNPQDINTIVMFWQMMDSLHYPGAQQALQFASMRAEEQRRMATKQAATDDLRAQQKLAVDAIGKMNKAPTNQGGQG